MARWRSVIRLAAALAAVLLVRGGGAAPVTYQFSTTVRIVDPSSAGFPASLAGVAVNDLITGRITYDASAPADANPFGGVLGQATHYPLGVSSVAITIDGVLLDSWAGAKSAFVWNDKNTVSADLNDGLRYQNTPMSGAPQYVIGNIVLHPGVLANEALPSGGAVGPLVLDVGLSNNTPWLQSKNLTLTPAPPLAGDFDGDYDVDGADLAVWKGRFGTAVVALRDGDADGDGDVDGRDFLTWQRQLGGAPSARATAAVPEPMSRLLALFGAITACAMWRTHSR